MPGVPDPVYVQARRILLDALDALAAHRDALILVGAQAIYLHTGEAAMEVAPYTTDADLTLNPQVLGPDPLLETALRNGGFVASTEPSEIGRWKPVRLAHPQAVIDLMVPEALAGKGSRAARLEYHGNRIARRARGLEAALVERALQKIAAFEPGDARAYEINVAGPGALLVAKLHKLGERAGQPDRLRDKDALDVLRLLRTIPTEDLAQRFQLLRRDELAGKIAAEGQTYLRDLFTRTDAIGTVMATRALAGVEDPATVAESCVLLASDLLATLPD